MRRTTTLVVVANGQDRRDESSGRAWSLVNMCRVVALSVGACVPLASERLSALDSAERWAFQAWAWAAWAIVLLCVLVPSTVALTTVRLSAPAHFVVIVVLAASNPDTGSLVAAGISAVMLVLVFSADIGHAFVRTSAYGDERRVLLRCPRPHVAVIALAWMAWTAAALGGVLALAEHRSIVGSVLVVIAAFGLVVLPKRFHRYSRRWLVSVPAGIVVHDHVVLAETAMFSRSSIASTRVVTVEGESADLSGGTRGPWLEIELVDFETVVRAPTPSQPGGSAIHVKSFRIRPSRLKPALDLVTS